MKVIESWNQIKKNSKLILSSEGLDNDEITYEIGTLKGGKKEHLLSQFSVFKKSEGGLYLKPKNYRGMEIFLQFNKIRMKDFIEII